MNDKLTEIVERARKEWRVKVIATLPRDCTDSDFDNIITRAVEEWEKEINRRWHEDSKKEQAILKKCQQELNAANDTIQQLDADTKRLNWLGNSVYAFDLLKIWKTEKGFHIGSDPMMETMWHPDLRTAIDEAMKK